MFIKQAIRQRVLWLWVMMGLTGVLSADGVLDGSLEFGKQEGRDFKEADLRHHKLTMTAFKHANLHSSSFNGAFLIRADVSGSNFCYASLRGAKLMEATGPSAHFVGAELQGSDLSRASFRNANFSWADLSGANLTGADFTNADFRASDLTGVNLSGAILTGARWDDAIIADLSGASAEQAADLKSKAARWKHGLFRQLDRLVSMGSLPVWLICWPLGAICLIRGMRKCQRKLPFILLSVGHLMATLPAAGYLFLIVTATSPTAQFNGPMSGWHTWFQLWRVGIVLLSIGLVALVPLAVSAWVCWLRSAQRPSRLLLVLSTIFMAISLLASFFVLVRLAPDA